jgi:hypothetical protein
MCGPEGLSIVYPDPGREVRFLLEETDRHIFNERCCVPIRGVANPVFSRVISQREHSLNAVFVDAGIKLKEYAETSLGDRGMRWFLEKVIPRKM